MKKLLYSFLILSSATLFAQQKFAVADNAIGTVNLFNSKKSVLQVSKTYTAANLPADLKKYSSIFTKGVTEYKFKNGENVMDRMSLAEINTQYGVAKDTPVFMGEHEFSDTSTMVYPQIIDNGEVKDYNGKKTLFITLK
ncbi:hypothetical protein EGY07_13415 [Chryseobacterium indologenes]|nr:MULTISPECIES: hypothetical protein [Chryseobacterium]ASE60450.1 hypothetical protein CEQ15_02455 [Chryseobacterium indologenes]ATN04634.1 hypothetical protein CRN76_04040 [Chryseobacterium indologenes]AYY86614.1 hypothetical protein EGX91_19720 [Chryseobacterium indologenes]AYZ36494.1 hypothetical protein EGY07_13415 [Chryseobacterium indologenes]MBF6645175.1 hypothetical protein [Chryseobacterium indologenes]